MRHVNLCDHDVETLPKCANAGRGRIEIAFQRRPTYAQHCAAYHGGGRSPTNYFTYRSRGHFLLSYGCARRSRLSLTLRRIPVSFDGPLPGTHCTTQFTYAVGRIRTLTDLDGYPLTFAYDNLDRLTNVTYPDPHLSITYDRLDPSVLHHVWQTANEAYFR